MGNRQNISSSLFLFSHFQFPIQARQQHIFLLCSTVRMANSNLVYSIIWIVVLWFITWPIAGFAAGFWILIQVCLTCNNALCRPTVPCHFLSLTILLRSFSNNSPLKHAFHSSSRYRTSLRSLSHGPVHLDRPSQMARLRFQLPCKRLTSRNCTRGGLM